MPRFASLSADAALVAAIDAAPAWAKLALSMRDPAMRERGTHELARSIVETVMGAPAEDTGDQPLLL